MIFDEKKTMYYNKNLYVVRLLNRVYYVLLCLAQNKDDKEKEFNSINNNFLQYKDLFVELEKDLYTNSLYKDIKGIVLNDYVEKLEKLLEEIKNEERINNSLLDKVFTMINNYTVCLESNNFDLSLFKTLTDFVYELIFNFSDSTIVFLKNEMAYVFLETLKIIKINRLEELISNTNPYFYDLIVSLAEEYVFNVILKNTCDPLYLEINNFKQTHDIKIYLKYLYEEAYKLNLLYKDSVFMKVGAKR